MLAELLQSMGIDANVLDGVSADLKRIASNSEMIPELKNDVEKLHVKFSALESRVSFLMNALSVERCKNDGNDDRSNTDFNECDGNCIGSDDSTTN